eukprot:TRINITY_DN27342_c0_g1_i3.p1 TRINITY_DN27342_c0_g1~~TRINITY_DN27342_c0_g1_i3.p1  ORF type:complete len:7452 (+),score=2231.22 TRINITY_DN27342_c0_g1_i3:1875-22358(+)
MATCNMVERSAGIPREYVHADGFDPLFTPRREDGYYMMDPVPENIAKQMVRAMGIDPSAANVERMTLLRRYWDGEQRARRFAGCDELMDYCPVWTQRRVEQGCRDPANLNGNGVDCTQRSCMPYSVAGPDSRCVLSSLASGTFASGAGGARSGACLPSSCAAPGKLLARTGELQGDPQWQGFACTSVAVAVAEGPGAVPTKYRAESGLQLAGDFVCPDASKLCPVPESHARRLNFAGSGTPLFATAGQTLTLRVRASESSDSTGDAQVGVCVTRGTPSGWAVSAPGSSCQQHGALPAACGGLQPDPQALTPDACLAACCADARCVLWQWANAGSSPPGCYLGTQATCTASSALHLVAGAHLAHSVTARPPGGIKCVSPASALPLRFGEDVVFTATHTRAEVVEVTTWGFSGRFTGAARQTIVVGPGRPTTVKLVEPGAGAPVVPGAAFRVAATLTDAFGNAATWAPGTPSPPGTTCPPSTVALAGGCFKYHSEALGRDEATAQCAGEGGTLADIVSDEQEAQLRLLGGEEWWTGLVGELSRSAVNLRWDSGASTEWFEKTYHIEGKGYRPAAWTKGCCAGLLMSGGEAAEVDEAVLSNSRSGNCVSYRAMYSSAAYSPACAASCGEGAAPCEQCPDYPFWARDCRKRLPFWCVHRPVLQLRLWAGGGATLAAARAETLAPDAGASRYSWTGVSLLRGGAAGPAPVIAAGACPVPAAGSSEVCGSSALAPAELSLRWAPSPPVRVAVSVGGAPAARFAAAAVEAGGSLHVVLDTVDLSGVFAAGLQPLVLYGTLPGGRQVHARCKAPTWQGECSLEIEDITTAGTAVLQASAEGGALEPAALELTVTAGLPCRIEPAPGGCPRAAMADGKPIPPVQFSVQDCYGNPARGADRLSLTLGGQSGSTLLSSSFTANCALYTSLDACCANQTSAASCTAIGCLWGHKHEDSRLCPPGKCCLSHNGPSLTPLRGGSFPAAPRRLCLGSHGTLFEATRLPRSRDVPMAGCSFQVGALAATEDWFYFEPSAGGELTLEVGGVAEVLEDAGLWARLFGSCDTDDPRGGSKGKHDSYLYDSREQCAPGRPVRGCRRALERLAPRQGVDTMLGEEACQQACQKASTANSFGDPIYALGCAGYQYSASSALAAPLPRYKPYTGWQEVMSAALRRVGCPSPVASMYEDWTLDDTPYPLTEGEVLDQMADLCERVRVGAAASESDRRTCCGVHPVTGKPADCRAAITLCAPPVMKRLPTSRCPITYPYAATDGSGLCCRHRARDGSCTSESYLGVAGVPAALSCPSSLLLDPVYAGCFRGANPLRFQTQRTVEACVAQCRMGRYFAMQSPRNGTFDCVCFDSIPNSERYYGADALQCEATGQMWRGRLQGQTRAAADGGRVTFYVGYNVAERIELVASAPLLGRCELGEDSECEGGQGGEGPPEEEEEEDNCAASDAVGACATTGCIRILSGPPGRLGVSQVPPDHGRSYGMGRCAPLAFAVRMEDSCGNPITQASSGELAEACANRPLEVEALHSGSMEGSPAMQEALRVLGDKALRDGSASLLVAYSRADCSPGVTLQVRAKGAACSSLLPALAGPVCFRPCVADHVEFLSPPLCGPHVRPPLPTVPVGGAVPAVEVAVMDADGNVVTEEGQKAVPLGCFRDIGGTAFPYEVALGAMGREACMLRCAADGATYFAMQNGRACWCGRENNYGRFGQLPRASCALRCIGSTDPAPCGGPEANLVYMIQGGFSLRLEAVDLATSPLPDPLPSSVCGQDWPDCGLGTCAPCAAAGQGGALAGQLNTPAVEGRARFTGAVWLPDGNRRAACLANPALANCTGLVMLRASVASPLRPVRPALCAAQVQQNEVACQLPGQQGLKVRAGEPFDLEAWLAAPGGAGPADTGTSSVNISVWDSSDELAGTDTVTLTPVQIQGQQRAVFAGLRFNTVLPRGASRVTRVLRFRAPSASECDLTVEVRPGAPTQCALAEPPRGCAHAGEPFGFELALSDQFGNAATQESPRCLFSPVRAGGCGSDQPAVPRTPAELEGALGLLDPLAAVGELRLGVLSRVRGLVAADSHAAFDMSAMVGWAGGAPPGAAERDAIRQGASCVVLRRTASLPARVNDSRTESLELAVASAGCEGVAALCASADTASCTGAVAAGAAAVVGDVQGSGEALPGSIAEGSTLQGQLQRPAEGGTIRFDGLVHTRAALRRQLSYNVSAADGAPIPCGLGTLTMDVAPGAPSRLSATASAQREIAPGVACIVCDSEDADDLFSVDVVSRDAFGNVNEHSCPESWDPDALVGPLAMELMRGSGRLDSLAQGGLRMRLGKGRATFSGLRYSRAERAVLRVDAPAWASASPRPTVPLHRRSCLPESMRVQAPRSAVAGEWFEATVFLSDRHGNPVDTDWFGLLNPNTVMSAVSMTPQLAHFRPAWRTARSLPQVFDFQPGRPTGVAGRLAFRVRQKRVPAAATALDGGAGVEVEVPPFAVDVALTVATASTPVSFCGARTLRASFSTMLRHNEPSALRLPLEYDLGVVSGRPFATGLRAQQLDKHGNPATDRGSRYGEVVCSLELSQAAVPVAGSPPEVYALVLPPTEDSVAEIEFLLSASLVVSRRAEALAAFDPSGFVAEVAKILAVVANAQGSSSPDALTVKSATVQGPFVRVVLELAVPYASEVANVLVTTMGDKKQKCDADPSDANCCYDTVGGQTCVGPATRCGQLCVAQPPRIKTEQHDPTLSPTRPPTRSPTAPTGSPTKAPTTPSRSPTMTPSRGPSLPTAGPTKAPTSPTAAPSQFPTGPTVSPTRSPTTAQPSRSPTLPPTRNPTTSPPSLSPTIPPTSPTVSPTIPPTQPTVSPTVFPTLNPTAPTVSPTASPSRSPTHSHPTVSPTMNPTVSPSVSPTLSPTSPTRSPTPTPTARPTLGPSSASPTASPTLEPTAPTVSPTPMPSSPTTTPTSSAPSASPTERPTQPTAAPSASAPSAAPTAFPSTSPTAPPTSAPPSAAPTTTTPTQSPTTPTAPPTANPSSSFPTKAPLTFGSPTESPLFPTKAPTRSPRNPTSPPITPTGSPTLFPTDAPTGPATGLPTGSPASSATLGRRRLLQVDLGQLSNGTRGLYFEAPDSAERRALTNAPSAADLAGNGAYADRDLFVPELLMGTTSSTGTLGGARRGAASWVVFRDSFARGAQGRFQLRAACERKDPARLGADDEEAPLVYAANTDWIHVHRDELAVVGAPSESGCRRAGSPLSFTVRLQMPAGGPPLAAPAGARIMARLHGGDQSVGPLLCDAAPALSAASGYYETTCSINTAAPPAAGLLGGVLANGSTSCNCAALSQAQLADLNGTGCAWCPLGLMDVTNADETARPGTDRATRWTGTTALSMVSFHHDAPLDTVGFASTAYARQISFVPGCPTAIELDQEAPEELPAGEPFDIAVTLTDRYGNVGGDVSLRVAAYPHNPDTHNGTGYNTEAGRSPWLHTGTGGTRTAATGGRATFSGLAIDPRFLSADPASDGFVWIKVWAEAGGRRLCDTDPACSPFLPGGECWAQNAGPPGADGSGPTGFGCLHLTYGPVLVAAGPPAGCRFTAFPSPQDPVIAGPRFAFSLRAQLVDKNGVAVRSLPRPLDAVLSLRLGDDAQLARRWAPDESHGRFMMPLASFDTSPYPGGVVAAAQSVGLDPAAAGLTVELWARLSPRPATLAQVWAQGAPALTVQLQATQDSGSQIVVSVPSIAGTPGTDVTLITRPLEPSATQGDWVLVRAIVRHDAGTGAVRTRVQVDGRETEGTITCQRPSCTCNATNCANNATQPRLPTAADGLLVGAGQVVFMARLWPLENTALPTADAAGAAIAVEAHASRDSGARPLGRAVATRLGAPASFSAPPPMQENRQIALAADSPLTAPSRNRRQYRLPRTCGPAGGGSNLTSPAGCVQSAAAYGVEWGGLWYASAPGELQFEMSMEGIAPCVTPVIAVRPGPPHRLACSALPGVHSLAAGPLPVAVGVRDALGNPADCHASFPAQQAPWGSLDVDCGTATVSAALADSRNGTARLLPDAALVEPLQRTETSSRAAARFSLQYRRSLPPALPLGGLEGVGVGATLPDFGINASLSAAAEGWALAPSAGTWEVGAGGAPFAPGGHAVPVGEGARYLLARRPAAGGEASVEYVTDGRVDAGLCAATALDELCDVGEYPPADCACRDYVPGRITSGGAYRFRIRMLRFGSTTDTASAVLDYRSPTGASLRKVTATFPPTSDAWHETNAPHLAPAGASHAVIRLGCRKRDANGDDLCRVFFDGLELEHMVGGERGTKEVLVFSTPLLRQDGAAVAHAVCGPVELRPAPERAAPAPASCPPEACSGHGVCDKDWRCPERLLRGYAAVCCARALSYCCGGRMRETGVDSVFRLQCGDKFCKESMPSPCLSCDSDDTRGHWAGERCERCAEGWTGAMCTVRVCPKGTAGKECSGHGVCAADGICTCFGADTAASGEAPALRVTRAALSWTPPPQPAPSGALRYATCGAAAAAFRAAGAGAPDAGVFVLETPADVNGAEYYCNFFEAQQTLYAGAMVGGVWSRFAGVQAATVSALGASYMPLSGLAGLLPGAGPHMFRTALPGAPYEGVGPEWAFTTAQDGQLRGGAFARAAAAPSQLTIFAASGAEGEWVMVNNSVLGAALLASNSTGSPVPLPAAAAGGKGLAREELCAYADMDPVAGIPTFAGLFACGKWRTASGAAQVRGWRLWYGEGSISNVRPGAKAVRVYSVAEADAGGMRGGAGASAASAPTQVRSAVPSRITTTTVGGGKAKVGWRKFEGEQVLEVAGDAQVVVETRFSGEQLLPSALADLAGVRIWLYVAQAPGSNASYSAALRLPDGKMSAPLSGVVPSCGGPSCSADLRRADLGSAASLAPLAVASIPAAAIMRGMRVVTTYSCPAGQTADVWSGATVLSVGYRKAPPMHAVSVSARVRLPPTVSTQPATLFQAAHSQGGSLSLRLNSGPGGGFRAGALLATATDSMGRVLQAETPDVSVLFSDRWVLFSVTVDFDARRVSVAVGSSRMLGGLPEMRQQPTRLLRHGAPVMRPLELMDRGLSWGSPAAPLSGLLRDLRVGYDAAHCGAGTPLLYHPLDVNGSLANGSASAQSGPLRVNGSAAWELAPVPSGCMGAPAVGAAALPPGKGQWAGDTCGECQEGWHGGSCNLPDCTSNATCASATCGAPGGQCHNGLQSGFCQLDRAKPFYGQCLCAPFYDGEHCKVCESHPVTGHTETHSADVTAKALVCTAERKCPHAGFSAGGVAAQNTTSMNGAWCMPGGRFRKDEYFQSGIIQFVNCTVAGSGAAGRPRYYCAPGKHAVRYDDCGCPLNQVPRCDPQTLPPAGTGLECCPSQLPAPAAPLQYDCLGYSNLFVSCYEPDECGRPAVPPPVCKPGTEGERQYPTWCRRIAFDICAADPGGETLTPSDRARFFGDCPSICSAPFIAARAAADNAGVDPADFTSTASASTGRKCGPCTTDVASPSLVDCRGSVYDVHAFQLVVKEDFCGCRSPPIPVCDAGTVKPSGGNGTAQGAQLRCPPPELCPDWPSIFRQSNLSLEIDCGGWPAPELAQVACSDSGYDPCGCPLPVFTCRPGTEGSCEGWKCPEWDTPEAIDCKGARPPVANAAGPHVCDCDFPPAPTCIEGTGPLRDCESLESARPVEIDCLGRPLSSNAARHSGPPQWRWQWIKGCSSCVATDGVRCRQQTNCPLRAQCPPNAEKGASGAYASAPCPTPDVITVPCENGELAVQPQDPCYCATVSYVCAACPECCKQDPSQCGAYACGASRDAVATPTDTCRTSCASPVHCALGFDCIAGKCEEPGTRVPTLGSCVNDASICEPYGCDPLLDRCHTSCFSDGQCQAPDYACDFASPTEKAATPAYERLGGAEDDGDEAAGCGVEEAELPGKCVKLVRDPDGCTTNKPDDPAFRCGLYACGKNNSQTHFSEGRCRQSCANNAHCSIKAHCDITTGVCVNGAPGSPASCASKDFDFCTPYACGTHRALQPVMQATCRTSCEEDGHCALFFHCSRGRCIPGTVARRQLQSPGDIPAACFAAGQSWMRGYAPWKCLRVPIGSSGDPFARVAYALPLMAPRPLLPAHGVPCSAHRMCRPYRCGVADVSDRHIPRGSTCQAACAEEGDCARGFTCVSKRCERQRAMGAQCRGDSECASGNCVDGLCCNSACNEPCQRCNDMGVCGWVDVGTDDRNDCGRCMTCMAPGVNDTTTAKRVCKAEPKGTDSKLLCGEYGFCNGGGGCQCLNNNERGHWAGAACQFCKRGWHGANCTCRDAMLVPPVVTNSTAGAVAPSSSVIEPRPVQWAVRVLDFSSQLRPKNVHGVVGEPDATTNYFKGPGTNPGKAWVPLQYTCTQGAYGCKADRIAWKDRLQYITLEFKEAIFLRQVYVYENGMPGAVSQILVQRAPEGAAASPGGGAPVIKLVNGVRTEVSVSSGASTVNDQALFTVPVGEIDTEALNVTAPGGPQTINPNSESNFEVVWDRGGPNFPAQAVASVLAADGYPGVNLTRTNTTIVYNNQQYVTEYKTKVIKLVLDTTGAAGKQVEIDAVGIVGFATQTLDAAGQCPGATTVPVAAFGDLTAGNATEAAVCSGNGMCGVRGCECAGNYDGKACDRCAFGWQGDRCDARVPLPESSGPRLCRLVMFEDINDFNDTQLDLRWSIQDYAFHTTTVYQSRHFGTKFVSPQITLGRHSHVRIRAGFFVIDQPNSADSGIIVRIARTRSATPAVARSAAQRQVDAERVVFIKNVPYQTGVNVIATGKGDTSDQMDVTFRWPHEAASVEFEIWSPDTTQKATKGDHRLTLTFFSIESCSYPSLAGTSDPDPDAV